MSDREESLCVVRGVEAAAGCAMNAESKSSFSRTSLMIYGGSNTATDETPPSNEYFELLRRRLGHL